MSHTVYCVHSLSNYNKRKSKSTYICGEDDDGKQELGHERAKEVAEVAEKPYDDERDRETFAALELVVLCDLWGVHYDPLKRCEDVDEAGQGLWP